MGAIARSGELITIDVTPTIDTNIYAAGDLVGGKLELPNAVAQAGGGGIVRSVALADQAKQSDAIDVLFFDADPSGTTFTNNAALDIADADLPKLIGFQQITSYAELSDNSIGRGEADRPLPFVLGAGATSLYAALVARATPTFAAATDLVLRVTIERR